MLSNSIVACFTPMQIHLIHCAIHILLPSTNVSTGVAKSRPTSCRCGLCKNCLLADCGEHKFCKDKPGFGGPGKLKQACIKRKCLKIAKSKPGGKVNVIHPIILFIEIGTVVQSKEIDEGTVGSKTASVYPVFYLVTHHSYHYLNPEIQCSNYSNLITI